MKKDGFTLIETTVVISIIALLLALSLTALSFARQRARAIVCQSNIRQIGLAFDMYHATHGAFPSAFVPFGSGPDSLEKVADHSIDWQGLWWFNYLDIVPARFSTQKHILRCPSKNYAELQYKYNDLWGNYGVNWSVCKSPSRSIMTGLFPEFSGSPAKDKSSKTLLLADSGYALLAWNHSLPDSHPRAPKSSYEAFNMAYIPGASVNEHKFLWPEQKADALTGRHPGNTVNCLFTDGHTDKKKADHLAVKPLDHGQFENLQPLWIPK